MAEDITIPKVGSVPKKIIIPLGIGIVGFVGWRYYQARNNAATATTDTTTSDFADGSTVPGVLGAVSPTNSYGDSGASDTSGTDTTRFTTNAQWSTYVRSQLQGSYDDAAIVAALGNYLGSQPLSDDQQTIVRGAIAVGGYPPVGSFSVIPGGNMALTIAPGNVRVQSIAPTSAIIAFDSVAGANSYRAYRNGAATYVASGSTSPLTITGLSPGTAYTAHVAAVSSAGTPGPDSGTVSFTTTSAAPGAVSGRKTTSTNHSILSTFKGAPNAVRYQVTLNSKHWNDVSGSPFTIPNLKPSTSYTIGIRAVSATGALGPVSNSTIRTKK